jgi:hypothetical protein
MCICFLMFKGWKGIVCHSHFICVILLCILFPNRNEMTLRIFLARMRRLHAFSFILYCILYFSYIFGIILKLWKQRP